MNPGVEGRYSSNQTSQYKDLNLLIEHRTIFLFDRMDRVCQYPIKDTVISSRVGNIPRRFRFPDGSLFETRDNDGVDQMLRSAKYRQKSWFFLLESQWKVAFFGLLILFALAYFFIVSFNSWLARKLAPSVPHSWSVQITDRVVKNFKSRKIFHPQKVDKSVELKKRILKHFEDFQKDFPSQKMYLEFVSSPSIKANAVAFPDGRIIVTDELLETFNSEGQVLGVLLHEIGHVYYYHPVEAVIKNLVLGLTASLIVGDGGFVAFSLMVLNNRYSREAEREADEFALNQMMQRGIPPESLAEALTHFKNQSQSSDIPVFLSTHPNIDSRIEQAQQRAEKK